MSIEVRPIRPEELEDWVAVMYLAFHTSRAPATGAGYWREILGQDYTRVLAAVEDEQRVVGTYDSFAAKLTLPGGACVPADAISAVSVLPTHHRRGLLTRMITHDLRAARDRGDVAAILLAAEYPIYGRFGFGPATERAEYRLDPSTARFLRPSSAHIDLVPPARIAEVAPDIFDRFRRRQPGQIDREPHTWAVRVGLRNVPWQPADQIVRCLLASGPSGKPEGYLPYRTEELRPPTRPGTLLDVLELITLSDDAYLGLLRFCCEIDLISEIKLGMRSTEEALPWLLHDARTALQQTRRSDYLWVRPLDVPRLLGERRYASEGRVVLEVADPLGLGGGRFELEAGPDGAMCRESSATADLSLGMMALGAISLGGVPLYVLHRAGLIEVASDQALERAERLFRWPVAPWCSTLF